MSPERASQGSTVCAPSTSGASRARTPASPISGINATSRAANASMQICAGSSVRYSPRKSGQTRWPLHSRAGRARASVQLTNVQTIPAENTAGAFRPEAPPACASVSTAAAASALQAYEAYDAHEPGVHIGRREVRRRSSRSGQSITRKAGMGPHRATATTITESTRPNSATRLKITSPAIAQMASSSSPTNRTGWRQSDAYPASHNVAGSPPTNPSSASMNHVRRRIPRSLARKASCQLPNVCNDGRASMPLAPSYPDRDGAGKRSDSPPDHAERSYTQYWGTEPIQLSSNLHGVVTYLGLYSSRSEQRTEVTFGLTGRLYEVGGRLRSGAMPYRESAAPVASAIASTVLRTAARASAGSSTAASPASLSTSRTSQSTPANGSSTITEPSDSSASTARSSRAHRARSGEISTRARREAGTSPVRGQPETSAAGSMSSRGSKLSPVTWADLKRSSRKCRTAPRARSKLARYQPSRPLISA